MAAFDFFLEKGFFGVGEEKYNWMFSLTLKLLPGRAHGSYDIGYVSEHRGE